MLLETETTRKIHQVIKIIETLPGTLDNEDVGDVRLMQSDASRGKEADTTCKM